MDHLHPTTGAKTYVAEDLRETDTFRGPSQEVVTLPDHERVVDRLREERDSRTHEIEAIGRLLDVHPGHSTISAAVMIARAREYERSHEDPLEIAIVGSERQPATLTINPKTEPVLDGFILKYFQLNPVEWGDVGTIYRWLDGVADEQEIEAALDRLVDDGKILVEAANSRGVYRWTVADRQACIEKRREIEGLEG